MDHSSPASFPASPACLSAGDRPDVLAVVDAEAGRIVGELPMPNVGDGLHRHQDGDLPVSPTLAHLGGMPVEEGLPAPAPAGTAAFACLPAEVKAWRRRR